MKRLFFVLALLFSVTSFSQVGSYPAGMFEDKITEIDATVYVLTDEVAFLISKNKIYTLEVNPDERMKKGWEYTFFVQLQDCKDDCKELKAIIHDFTPSVRQTYDNIRFLKDKHGLK